MPQCCCILVESQAQYASQTTRDGPRCSKRRPKTAQDAPKTPPRGPQDGQDAQPERDMRPAGTRAAPTRAKKRARDASRSLQALILAGFWKVLRRFFVANLPKDNSDSYRKCVQKNAQTCQQKMAQKNVTCLRHANKKRPKTTPLISPPTVERSIQD